MCSIITTIIMNSKYKILSLIFFPSFFFVGTYCFAATNTWQTGGVNNNWSTAGNWSLGHVPAAGEDVSVSANYAMTVDVATNALNSFNTTGYTNTISGSGNITVTVSSGVSTVKFAGIDTWTGTLNLNPAAGTTINLTNGGATTWGGLTITGTTTGAVYMLDGLTIGITKTVALNSGTLHTDGAADNAGLTHSWGLMSLGTAGLTKTMTLGNSTINMTGTVSLTWDMRYAAGLTFNANTSTINMTGNGAPGIYNATQSGSGAAFNAINFTGAGIPFLNLANIATIVSLTRTGTAVKTDGFQIYSGVTTVTGTFTINGNSPTNRLVLYTDVLGTKRTINLTGATVSTNNVDFRDITFARTTAGSLDLTNGGANLIGDAGGNSRTGGNGIVTFTTSAPQNFTNVAGGNWSTTGNWTSRIPLPQDDVTFSTAFNSGVTITADMPRLGRTIDFSGASATGAGVLPAFTLGNNVTNYGGLKFTGLKAGGFTGAYSWTFNSQARSGTYYITSNGQFFPNNVAIATVGEILQLADPFVINTGQTLNLQNGTFIDAGFSVIMGAFANSNATTRGVTKTGNWTMTDSGTNTVWNFLNSSMTWSDTAGTITISDAGTGVKTFAGGGVSYSGLTATGGGTGAVIITGSNTFNTITVNAPKNLTLTGGTTQTVTNFVAVGSAGNLITLNSPTLTTVPPILNKTGGGQIQSEFVNIQGVNVTPAYSWFTGNHSQDKLGVNFGSQAISGGMITISNSAIRNQIYGTTDFSAEVWFVARSLGATAGRLIDKTEATAATIGWAMVTNSSNQYGVYLGEAGNSRNTYSGTTITPNVLHHFVFTWHTGQSPRIYIDGSVTGGYGAQQVCTTPTDDSTYSLHIGNQTEQTRTFDGVIFAVRVYRGVNLSAANVATLYNAGFKASNPIGNATSQYLLNEGTGTTTADSIGGVTGTLSAQALWANTGWNTGEMPNFFNLFF